MAMIDDGPRQFMGLNELAANLCLAKDEVLEAMKAGELPRPEKQGERFVWRWEDVERQLRLGADACHCIYFVQIQEFIKIGFTTNLRRRLKAIEHASPYEMKLLFHMPGDLDMEADLHRKFKHLRVWGEWFRREPELMAYIAELERS